MSPACHSQTGFHRNTRASRHVIRTRSKQIRKVSTHPERTCFCFKPARSARSIGSHPPTSCSPRLAPRHPAGAALTSLPHPTNRTSSPHMTSQHGLSAWCSPAALVRAKSGWHAYTWHAVKGARAEGVRRHIDSQLSFAWRPGGGKRRLRLSDEPVLRGIIIMVWCGRLWLWIWICTANERSRRRRTEPHHMLTTYARRIWKPKYDPK
jgi:hypothetical protein